MGTKVHDASGRKIGRSKTSCLDKMAGNIMFAVVSFGGFLGLSEKYHPVPWSSLRFDKAKGSTSIEFTKEQIEAAPAAIDRRAGT